MKKILALALCVCFCLSVFAACGLKDDEKGANIQVYLSDFPQSLDPAIVQANADVNQILSLIFEPLTKINSNGKVVGALAKSWYSKYDKVNQEYAIYFELNTSYWSNSYLVTADDVVYAWKRILNPSTESPYASLLYCIKNAKAVKAGIMTSDDLGLTAEDDDLLKVVFEDAKDFTEEEAAELGISAYVYDDDSFSAACDAFAETVANVHLSPVREDVVKRYTDYKPEGSSSHVYQWGDYSAASIVGNGPFKVQAYEIGNKIVLERNSYYRYDEDNAVDKYVKAYRLSIYYYEGQYKYSTDDSSYTQDQYQAYRYENGDIYYLGAFDKTTYSTYASKMKVNQTTNGYALLYNTQTIGDADVRKALSAAIDRDYIVSNFLPTAVASTGYVPQGVYDSTKGTSFRKVAGNTYSEFTTANASSLLNGKKVGTLKMVYLIPNDISRYSNYSTIRKDLTIYNVYEDIANYMVQCWADLGITVKAEGLVYDDYMAALKAGDFDIIGYNVVMDSTEALAYLAPYATMYSGRTVSIDLNANSYTVGYTLMESEEYDALIDKATYTADRKEKATILHEAEEMLTDLCPAFMVCYYNYCSVSSSKLSGLGSADYFGAYSFSNVNLSDWRSINAKEEEESIALEEKNEE